MRRVAGIATGIVLLNLAVSLLHGAAHQQLDVQLNSWQWMYVLITNTVAPVLAMILFWTRFLRTASLMLFLSMLAILIFGVYFHFILPSNDHIAHLPEGHGHALFITTAILLVPAEALGAVFGLWSWSQLGSETGAKKL